MDGRDIPGLSGLRIFQSGEAANWARLHAQRFPVAGIVPCGAHATLIGGPWSVFGNGIGVDFQDATGPCTVTHISGDNNGNLIRVKNYLNGLTSYFSGTGLELVLVNPKAETQVAGKNDPTILIDDVDQGSITIIGGGANNEVVGTTAADYVKVAALTHAAGPAIVSMKSAPYASGYSNLLNDVPASRTVPFQVAGAHPEILANGQLVLVNGSQFFTVGTKLSALFPNTTKADFLSFNTDGSIRLRSAGFGLLIQTQAAVTGISLDESGNVGVPGPLRFRGAWAANTAYIAGDVVMNQSLPYLATSSFTSGSTFNSANWLPLVDGGLGFPSTVDLNTMRSSDALALTANMALYLRCKEGGTISKVGLEIGASSGNISIAVYRNSGAGRSAQPTNSRLATTGAIACPSTGYQEVSLGATVAMLPGDWLALSADNATATFRSVLSGPGTSNLGLGVQLTQLTAHPLPSTPSSLVGSLGRSVALVGVP